MNPKKIKLSPKYKKLFKNDHNCRYVIVTGGRGSGKSFCLATFLRDIMCRIHDATILFSRYTMASAPDSIMKEFDEKVDLLNLRNRTDGTKNTIIDTITNTELLFKGIKTGSGNQTANLKGITNLSIFVIDEAEELVDEDVFDKIQRSVRVKGQQNLIIIVMNPSNVNHWVYKRFFEYDKIDPRFCGVHDDTLYIYSNYLDNIDNLDAGYIKDIEKTRERRPDKFEHEIMGGWLTDTEGALWNLDMILNAKRLYNDNIEPIKIVVGVDPSVTSSGDQDECGIIVAAKLPGDNNYVVLDDFTGTYTPAEWGKKVIEAYDKWDANTIVVETNQGGDLVVDNILNSADQNKRKQIKIEKVHASKGKIARAEPIATLYDNDCVAHAPKLNKLEFELTTYTGAKGQASPGRYDALVWAITYLTQSKRKKRIFV